MLLAAALAAVVATRGDAVTKDTTASLVPPDALVYAHVSTNRTQDEKLIELAGRFTTLRERLAALAPSVDFERDVRPWIGDDAAVAQTAAGPLFVASVRDEQAAKAALKRLGASSGGSYKGVALQTVPDRGTAAMTEDHLVVGAAADVRGAIDRAAGKGTPSLAESRVFRRADEQRSGGSSVDVFASAAGLRRMLERAPTRLASRLVAGPRLEGVALAAAAEEDGVRVTGRVLRAPGARDGDAFAPAMAARAPKAAAAFLELPGLDAAAGLVGALGGAAQLEVLRDALPQAAGIELDDLLDPLSRDAGLTVTPSADGPVFTVAARTSDAADTRESLARLQGPLSGRLAGGSPFTQREAGGADAFTLPVTDALEPSYAVAKDRLVASTARSGLEQLGRPKAPITEATVLQNVMPEEGAKVEALGFLDPRALLTLGEQTGLPVPISPAVRDDLRRIRAAGLVVEEDAKKPTDTTVELFLEIP